MSAFTCYHLAPKSTSQNSGRRHGQYIFYVFMRDTIKVTMPFKPLESYREALELVTLLLRTDPDGIRKMREEEPMIGNTFESIDYEVLPGNSRR